MKRDRGTPYIISAPSGTGKTTVCRALVERDSQVELSVSHTTRLRREDERDGVDYTFVTSRRFREMVNADSFVEWAEYAGRLYGTSWEAIDGPLLRAKDLVLEIEVQGAAQIRERRKDAYLVFLLPPSLEELEKRLRARATDTEDAIERRLALIKRELAAIVYFDYAVINDDLEECIDAVEEIIHTVRNKKSDNIVSRYGRDAVIRRLQGQFDFGPAAADLGKRR